MLQGDSYDLGIHILNNAGSAVTPQEVSDVEITIGPLRKTYSAGQLRFYDGVWLFPLSQQDTLGCPAAPRAQVRVRWRSGAVEGKPLLGLRIGESISREVL